MTEVKLPVAAVIPAYNEEANIGSLIEQVANDNYDSIWVLDDASTDNTVEAALAIGAGDVTIVRGNKNIGSGGNRNRIIPHLGQSTLIHFMDADVILNSKDNPDIVRELVSPDIGFTGGLIRDDSGRQMPYNFGPRFSAPEMVSSWIYTGIYRLQDRAPIAGQRLRSGLNKWQLMSQWPNPFEPPVARDVFWAAEANTAISSDTFKRTGGYNPNLRYHEVLDYSMRLEKLGLRRRFDPALDVTHRSDANLNNNANTKDFWTALAKIAGGMSVKELLTSQKLES